MILALVASAALAQGYYSPAEAQALFAEGVQAYDRAEYDRAIEAWEKLVDRGMGGPDVLYNLGTAHLRKGDLGPAVLHLERARRARPGDEDVRAHLDAARSKQVDQVVGDDSEPFVQRLAAVAPARTTAWIFLAAWLLAFAFTFAYRALLPGKRLWAALAAAALFALALPAGALVGVQAYVARTVREAVVMRPTLPARELPSPHGRVSFEVHAGLKVRVLATEGDFVQIRLPNGLVGWTERGGVAEI